MFRNKREGYLLIDNRAAPEVPSPLGCDAPPALRAGEVLEAATYTCKHCQRIVVMRPDRTRERAKCFSCNAVICDQCGIVAVCRPYERFLDDLATAIAHGKPLPDIAVSK